MTVTVTRKELADALARVGRITASTTSLPVLRNVLLQAGPTGLLLAATDLELALQTTIPARVEQDGQTTVPAGTLAEIVRALPEADVILEHRDDQLHLTCRRSAFKIRTLPAEEFPALPEVGGESMPIAAADLLRAINETIYACSPNDTRPILTGCLLHPGQMVATDTHRLAIACLASGPVPLCILPRRALVEVAKNFPPGADLQVKMDDHQALFSDDRTSLVTRLIEGQFPKYDRVIPRETPTTWTVPREELIGCLKRARILAADCPQADRVVIAYELGSLHISAYAETGTAAEEVEIESTGFPIKTAFNVAYLLDVLQACTTERVVIGLTEPLSPVSIRPEGGDYLAVVMPMQVTG